MTLHSLSTWLTGSGATGSGGGHPARRRASELLELVGIPAAAAERYPHEFADGMRRRASIAMALACQPRVLLADEHGFNEWNLLPDRGGREFHS
jgi:ABC-type glutathione transport system ATPase component